MIQIQNMYENGKQDQWSKHTFFKILFGENSLYFEPCGLIQCCL